MRRVIVMTASALLFGCSDFGGSGDVAGQPADGGSEAGVVTGTAPDNSIAFVPFASPNYVIHGESAAVHITLERGSEAVGPVVVTAAGLPTGVRAMPTTVNGDTGDLMLIADEGVPQGAVGGTLQATVNGMTISTDLQAFVRGKPGEIDTTFGANGTGTLASSATGFPYEYVADVVLAPDDSFYLVFAGAVAHIAADGKLDTNYGTAGKAALSWYPQVGKLQADGKLLLAGAAVQFTGTPASIGGAGRLLANGTNDTSFDFHTTSPYLGVGGLSGFDYGATSIAIGSSGDVFIGWQEYDDTLGEYFCAISHVQPNGTFVSGFGPAGAVRPTSPTLSNAYNSSAPFLVAGGSGIPTGDVAAIWVQTQTVNGSDYESYLGFNQLLGASGGFDPVVHGPTVVDVTTGAELVVKDVTELPDGSVVAALYSNLGATPQAYLYKFAPIGGGAGGFSAADLSGAFSAAVGQPSSITTQLDGHLLVSTSDARTVRFTAAGQLDEAFGASGIAVAAFQSDVLHTPKSKVIVQTTGRILTIGTATTGGTTAIAYTAFWP